MNFIGDADVFTTLAQRAVEFSDLDASDLLDLAAGHLAYRRVEEARALVARAQNLSSDLPESWLLLAEMEENFSLRRELLQEVLRLDPENRRARYLLQSETLSSDGRVGHATVRIDKRK